MHIEFDRFRTDLGQDRDTEPNGQVVQVGRQNGKPDRYSPLLLRLGPSSPKRGWHDCGRGLAQGDGAGRAAAFVQPLDTTTGPSRCRGCASSRRRRIGQPQQEEEDEGVNAPSSHG